MNEDIKYLVVDLFCGAGGVTTGFAEAQFNGNPFVDNHASNNITIQTSSINHKNTHYDNRKSLQVIRN